MLPQLIHLLFEMGSQLAVKRTSLQVDDSQFFSLFLIKVRPFPGVPSGKLAGRTIFAASSMKSKMSLYPMYGYPL